MSASAFRAFRTVLFVGCALILPIAGVFAQEEAGYADPAGAAIDAHTLAEQAIILGEGGAGIGVVPPVISPMRVFQVILTLAVVAAAIYGFVFLLKKASRGGGRASQDPFLKVLATVPVGTNRGVHVVSVGSQAWLVGSAEQGVNLIGEITDKETLDDMKLADSRKSAEFPAGRLPDFKSMLRRLGAQGDPPASGPENIRRQSDRLKGL